MKLIRHFLATAIVLLFMVLAVTTITIAQSLGPKEDLLTSPVSPTPPPRALAQNPDFYQEAEEILQQFRPLDSVSAVVITDGFDFPVAPWNGRSDRPPWYASYNVQNPHVQG